MCIFKKKAICIIYNERKYSKGREVEVKTMSIKELKETVHKSEKINSICKTSIYLTIQNSKVQGKDTTGIIYKIIICWSWVSKVFHDVFCFAVLNCYKGTDIYLSSVEGVSWPSIWW